MPVENRQIASGAITDTKVSKNAGIKGSKLEVAEPGQILVADEKGRFQPKHVDFEKCCDKELADDVLRGGELKEDQIFVGGRDGVPVQVPAITDPERVVKTDPGGTVTDDVFVPAPQVPPVIHPVTDGVVTDNSNQSQIYTVQIFSQTTVKGHLEFVTPSTPGTIKSYTFNHNLGYKPDVMVLEHDSQIEIDTQVSVTETTATVDLSDAGQRLRVIVQ